MNLQERRKLGSGVVQVFATLYMMHVVHVCFLTLVLGSGV